MKKSQGKTVFVGLSGGVDSSVAALLLKQAGYDVTSCFIRGWYPPGIVCSWQEDRRDAMRVALRLGLSFETVNLEREYKRGVVDYMLREYRVGRTPNPDIMCNRDIKFGAFLGWARRHGADYIATGHYVKKREHTTGYVLRMATDADKDQSYFLWTLGQRELSRALFPLGDLTKTKVRELAREATLPTAEKPDSQGVCFIGEFKMEDFLKRYIKPKKGKIVTTNGEVVGEHEGAFFYTLGQRKGLGVGGGGVPLYVLAKDLKKNALIVGSRAEERERAVRTVVVKGVHWITGRPPGDQALKARVRYRQSLQSCRIKGGRGSSLRILFLKPQRAVTPGQSLVLYSGQTLLGGGVIA